MLVAGVILLAAGIGIEMRGGGGVEEVKGGADTSVRPYAPGQIQAEVAGEVMKPGVYKFSPNDRINDALVAAGGLSAKADREWVEKNINRAERVKDGVKILIPEKSQAPNSKSQTSSPPEADSALLRNDQISNDKQVLGQTSLININTAGVGELDKLPGVGPAIAGRIIEYREKNGGFKNINELKLVSGVGEKLYEKIKGMVGI